MLEMKITIEATDLAAAINNLANAIDNKKAVPVDKPSSTEASAPVAQQPVEPVTPPVTPAVVPTAPTQAPTTQTAEAPAAPVVPTAAPNYTLEMISKAGVALVDAGKMDELCKLLAKYGVSSITELNPAQYGTIATELRALGAQI